MGIVIGISGKAMSGKDTVGAYLIQKYNFTRLSFAEELKEICIKYFDVTTEECYVTKTKYSRKLLQSVGMMFRQEVSDGFWIQRVLRKMRSDKNYVITDVRFLNEALCIGEGNGNFLIRVNRPNSPEIECGANHASETELDKHKFITVINNDKLISDLHIQIDKMMETIL